MEIIEKQILLLVNKYFIFNVLVLALIFITMISCRHENNFYYQIEDQKIISCDKKGIVISLEIENDSIKKDGFPYEPGKILRWVDKTNQPPHEINLNNIPKGYSLSIGGGKEMSIDKIKFKPNSRYTIIKQGYGDVEFEIKIWTDSIGRVYKTTHPNCELKSFPQPLCVFFNYSGLRVPIQPQE